MKHDGSRGLGRCQNGFTATKVTSRRLKYEPNPAKMHRNSVDPSGSSEKGELNAPLGACLALQI